MLNDGCAQRAPEIGYALERLSVLIVDDNRHMLNLVAEILRGLSIRQIRSCTDAADAFRELQIVPIDFIIVDYAMDLLNGIDFIKLVRSANDSSDIFVPIIMISGYSDVGTVEGARDAGVNAFLAKPVSPKSLYNRLLDIINCSRPYVRCANYFGPDRRRQHRVITHHDRRVCEPKVLKPVLAFA